MGRKKKEAEDLSDDLVNEAIEGAQPTETEINKVETENKVPERTSPEWTKYVLSLFHSSELFDGRPKVHGLARLTELLIGEIIESEPYPVGINLARGNYNAAMKYVVVVKEHNTGLIKRFCEIADSNNDNCSDPKFGIFPSCMAATRARARALRNALMIDVTTADEMPKGQIPTAPFSIENENAKINKSQKTFIELTCKKNNIDVHKFINSGKGKYEDINDIPYESAQKMLKVLSGYQQKTEEIPEGIKLAS
jgi:hypothetical protein